MARESKIKKQFREKVKSSGLPEAFARSLGMKPCTPANTAKLQSHYREAISLLIPYHSLKGKATGYHRVRYLETVGFGIGRKYDCPKGQPPQAYFPKTLPWRSLISDVDETLVITEGELKAACAAYNKINCIGLGGVWSWKSKKLGMTFLPELEDFEWEDRNVELCFDSDMAAKSQVRSALIALARELTSRGALCTMIVLPDGPANEKLGLDDFIVRYGVDNSKRCSAYRYKRMKPPSRSYFQNGCTSRWTTTLWISQVASPSPIEAARTF
jgi:hypothetical protein